MGRANWLWPKIENVIDARNASRTGANWAIVAAGISTLMAIIAIVTGKPIRGSNGWSLVDGAFYAMIAWRLFRYSFPWAIVGLLTLILEQIVNLIYSPYRIGILTIFILFGLIHAVPGTYFLRNEKKKSQASETVVSATENNPIEPI